MDPPKLPAEYQVFMIEIFKRLSAIDESLAEINSSPDNSENWKNCDFCWMQMRKICEYLALAILLAHYRESENNSDIRKWRPRDILGDIARINEFPTPIPVNLETQSEGHHHAIPIFKPLSLTLLGKIYGQCSELIHAGSLERMLDQKLPSFDISQMLYWSKNLRGFLANHILLLPKLKHALVCRTSVFPRTPPEVFLIQAECESCFDTGNLEEFDWDKA